MTSKIKFNKNLNKIIKDTSTSVLIIPEIDGECDVTSFLNNAKRVMGENYIERLNGVVEQDENSRYQITNMMKMYKGITIPYEKNSDGIYKNAIILFDTKNISSQRIGYHEGAHTIQWKEELLKNIDGYFDKDGKKSSYGRYLEEAYAESFAACCILYDSENAGDFRKRQSFLLSQAASDEILGQKSDKKDYPSDKYYAHFKTLKPLILEYKKIFFDSPKNYKTVAKVCEKHVAENVMSKDEFQNYIISSKNDNDKELNKINLYIISNNLKQ